MSTSLPDLEKDIEKALAVAEKNIKTTKEYISPTYAQQVFKQELSHNQQKHEAQLQYLRHIFIASVFYIAIVLDLVYIQMVLKNGLSDAVLITLLTTTVIGVFIIATKWLFPHQANTAHKS